MNKLLIALSIVSVLSSCKTEEERAQERRDEWMAEVNVSLGYSDWEQNQDYRNLEPGTITINPGGLIEISYGTATIDNELFTEKVEIKRESSKGTSICEIEEHKSRDEKTSAANYLETVYIPTTYSFIFTASDGTTHEIGPWEVVFNNKQVVAKGGWTLANDLSSGGPSFAATTTRYSSTADTSFTVGASSFVTGINFHQIEIGSYNKDGRAYLISPSEFSNAGVYPEFAGVCELREVKFKLWNDTIDINVKQDFQFFESFDMSDATPTLEIVNEKEFVLYEYYEGNRGIAEVTHAYSTGGNTIEGLTFKCQFQTSDN